MKIVTILLAFALAVLAAPTKERRDVPIYPSNDPFYQAPAGFESQPVGTILKSRKRDNPFGVIVIPEILEATYQFLVRSEDTFGNPNAIATTLFIPNNADPSKLLSYQSAEDSAYINCSPSYAMQLNSDPSSYISPQVEQILAQVALNEGWYVVVPDYEGPKSAFGCGLQAGKAVLNSIRAVLLSGSTTGINQDAKVSYWGYSGGSIATGWASLLLPTYAPDLTKNNVGAAYGGIVANVEHTAQTNMGSPFASLIFSAMNGLSAEYPVLNDYINSNVFPDKLDQFRDAKNECLVQALPEYAFATWTDYFMEGDNTLNNPIVKNVTSQNNMILSGLVPNIPLYFYNSVLDEVIPASDADDLYSHLCDAGVSIEYSQDLVGGHVTQQILGSGAAFTWLKKIMNGESTSGCSKQTVVSNALTTNGIVGIGDEFKTALLTFLLFPLHKTFNPLNPLGLPPIDIPTIIPGVDLKWPPF